MPTPDRLELSDNVRRVLAAIIDAAGRGEFENPEEILRPVPVKGSREAAALLRVGRRTLTKKINQAPPHLRPCNMGEDDAPIWWWRSRQACLDWWHELHAPPPPPKPRRSKKRPQQTPNATEDPAVSRRDRWDALTGKRT